MPTYTRGDIKGRVNAGIKGKNGVMVDVDETINTAVRQVLSEVDMRSTRRKVQMLPGLFASTFEYFAPVDLKGQKIISLQEQSKSGSGIYRPYSLVTYEEFGGRRKMGTIAVHEHDNLKKLLISGPQGGVTGVISNLDTLDSGGGLWVAFGDGDSVSVDDGDYTEGSGSIKFGINALAGTTAGIVNTALDTFDYSAFEGTNDSFLVMAKIASVAGLNSITIRYGDDAANYNEITVTQTHFGTVFATGWNLLRFDVSNRTTVGTVTNTAGEYVALFMNKDTTKINERDYKFDYLVLRNGIAHVLFYYSKYGWQDGTTGAWKANATSDSDLLNADEDEYNLFLNKCIELAGDEVDELQASQTAAGRYVAGVRTYTADNPSDAMLLTTDYQAQYYI